MTDNRVAHRMEDGPVFLFHPNTLKLYLLYSHPGKAEKDFSHLYELKFFKFVLKSGYIIQTFQESNGRLSPTNPTSVGFLLLPAETF